MICPHCNEDGIPALSKFFARTAFPARCALCNKPSSTSSLVRWISGPVFYFVYLGAAIASFFYRSWWPILIAGVAHLLFDACTTKWAPLIATTDDQVNQKRKYFYVFIGSLILLVVLSGVFGA